MIDKLLTHNKATFEGKLIIIRGGALFSQYWWHETGMILVRTGSTSTTTLGGWADQTPKSVRVDSVATGGRRAIWRRGRPRGDPCGAARREKKKRT